MNIFCIKFYYKKNIFCCVVLVGRNFDFEQFPNFHHLKVDTIAIT